MASMAYFCVVVVVVLPGFLVNVITSEIRPPPRNGMPFESFFDQEKETTPSLVPSVKTPASFEGPEENFFAWAKLEGAMPPVTTKLGR